jgi:putative transposase
MIKAPSEYCWSSYRVNALGEANSLITPHHEYLSLGASPKKRQQAYRELFVALVDDPNWALIRAATQQGVVVGDSRFSSVIEKRLGQAVQPRPRGRPRKEPAQHNSQLSTTEW